MKIKWYFYFVSIFFGLLLGFLLLEVYFRLFSPQILYDECTNHAEPKFVFLDGVGYVLKPNLKMCEYRWDTHRKVSFTTNNAGFRMQKEVLEKGKGMKRIILLGDSFVEGSGLDDNETIAHRLAALLPKKYEIINAGMSGTGTGQQLLWLKNVGMKYKPDVVVLFFYPNDFTDNLFSPTHFVLLPDGNLTPIIERRESVRAERKFIIGFLTRHSHTAAFFYNIYGRLRLNTLSFGRLFQSFFWRLSVRPPDIDSTIASMQAVYTGPMHAAFMVTMNILKEFKDFQAENSFHLILVLIPSRAQFSNQEIYESLRVYNNIEAVPFVADKQNVIFQLFSKTYNISFFDLMSQPSFYAKQGKVYFKEDNHFSPFGAQLTAQLVYKKLLVDGVVDVKDVT